jgi:hypothetical protein
MLLGCMESSSVMKRILSSIGIVATILLGIPGRSEASILTRYGDGWHVCMVVSAPSQGEAQATSSEAGGPRAIGESRSALSGADSLASWGDSRGAAETCVWDVEGSDCALGGSLAWDTDPEPATLAIWTGIALTWAGASWWRRRRQTMEWAARPRVRAGRRSRTPWPDHVRVAIREIIERGLPR